ncbi:hypothetical protein BB561_006278 [Smittium simulii]|uniref:Uncharacterized protein n=1 Tax=Smittium simulii TaxID=133385 RepID=A0A2T9Y5F2_9FUNG|nr:hypothetical protein BB561_006278 [Smittium simulii]
MADITMNGPENSSTYDLNYYSPRDNTSYLEKKLLKEILGLLSENCKSLNIRPPVDPMMDVKLIHSKMGNNISISMLSMILKQILHTINRRRDYDGSYRSANNMSLVLYYAYINDLQRLELEAWVKENINLKDGKTVSSYPGGYLTTLIARDYIGYLGTDRFKCNMLYLVSFKHSKEVILKRLDRMSSYFEKRKENMRHEEKKLQ